MPNGRTKEGHFRKRSDDNIKDGFEKEQKKNLRKRKINTAGIIIGIILILIGIIWAAYVMGLIPPLIIKMWPQVALIVIGICIVIKSIAMVTK